MSKYDLFVTVNGLTEKHGGIIQTYSDLLARVNKLMAKFLTAPGKIDAYRHSFAESMVIFSKDNMGKVKKKTKKVNCPTIHIVAESIAFQPKKAEDPWL